MSQPRYSDTDASPTISAGVPSARLVYMFDLVRELVVRDVKLRYERSILGVLWAVLNPLVQLAVFTVVFKYIIRLNIPNYGLFVFTGVLVWNWTKDGLMRAAGAIVGNRELIRRPGFPVYLLPVVALFTPLIDLLIGLPIALVLLIITVGPPSFALLFLPILIVLQFFLLQGVGYVVAALQVTFRDTSHLLNIVLMLMFYMTPVFYDISRIPEPYRSFYGLNPMAQLIGAYREVVMQGRLPDLRIVLVLAIVAGALWWFGRRVFDRASHRFAEEL